MVSMNFSHKKLEGTTREQPDHEIYHPNDVNSIATDHEITHYHLSYYFEIAVECINSAAGMIVLVAVLLAGINMLIISFNVATGSKIGMIDPLHSHKKDMSSNACAKSSVLRIRLMMGEQIALALGLLVASDILDTVIKPSHAYELLDVVKMGFVTVLRTGLAYFLAREIKELEEDQLNHNLETNSEDSTDKDSQSLPLKTGLTKAATDKAERHGIAPESKGKHQHEFVSYPSADYKETKSSSSQFGQAYYAYPPPIFTSSHPSHQNLAAHSLPYPVYVPLQQFSPSNSFERNREEVTVDSSCSSKAEPDDEMEASEEEQVNNILGNKVPQTANTNHLKRRPKRNI